MMLGQQPALHNHSERAHANAQKGQGIQNRILSPLGLMVGFAPLHELFQAFKGDMLFCARPPSSNVIVFPTIPGNAASGAKFRGVGIAGRVRGHVFRASRRQIRATRLRHPRRHPDQRQRQQRKPVPPRHEAANGAQMRGITWTLANDLIGTGPSLRRRNLATLRGWAYGRVCSGAASGRDCTGRSCRPGPGVPWSRKMKKTAARMHRAAQR